MEGTVPEPHEPFHHVFIGVEGEVEVGQGFLQFQHAEKFLVLQGFPDLVFNDVGLLVDLLQEKQEGRRGLGQDLEQEPGLLVGLEGSEGIAEEFLNHRIRFQAYRDEVLPGNEDAQRQGVVGIGLQDHRRIDDDENVVIFQLHVGPFFPVQRGLQGVHGDPGELVQLVQFIRIRGGTVNP